MVLKLQRGWKMDTTLQLGFIWSLEGEKVFYYGDDWSQRHGVAQGDRKARMDDIAHLFFFIELFQAQMTYAAFKLFNMFIFTCYLA